MSGESWTAYGFKFTCKLAAKVGLNVAMPGAGSVVDFTEAAWNLYDGNIVGALISTVSGISDILTLGLSSAAKDLATESGKKAVSEAAKKGAGTAAKKATKKVGEKLAKDLATGTITASTKAAAIEAAKVTAGSAAKEATKKVGEQVGKDLAKGVVNDAIERVFYDGTKITFQNFVKAGSFSMLSSGGKNAVNTVATDLLQEFGEKYFVDLFKGSVKQNVQMFACDFARKAALKSAEKEFANYATKVFVKDLAAVSAKGVLNRYGVEKGEDNWVGSFHYYSPTYYNNPMVMSGTFPTNMKKT